MHCVYIWTSINFSNCKIRYPFIVSRWGDYITEYYLIFFIISCTCTLKKVSRLQSPAPELVLFVRFVGQQLLVTLQTGGCTCVFVPPVQGYGKCLLVIPHRKTKGRDVRRTSFSSLLSLFQFPLPGSLLTSECVPQGVDLHTQHEQWAIKTAPCHSALE